MRLSFLSVHLVHKYCNCIWSLLILRLTRAINLIGTFKETHIYCCSFIEIEIIGKYKHFHIFFILNRLFVKKTSDFFEPVCHGSRFNFKLEIDSIPIEFISVLANFCETIKLFKIVNEKEIANSFRSESIVDYRKSKKSFTCHFLIKKSAYVQMCFSLRLCVSVCLFVRTF